VASGPRFLPGGTGHRRYVNACDETLGSVTREWLYPALMRKENTLDGRVALLCCGCWDSVTTGISGARVAKQ